VMGSVLIVSLNGKALLMVGWSEAEGCPKRWLKSPPRLREHLIAIADEFHITELCLYSDLAP
jgi:hypothetical protein